MTAPKRHSIANDVQNLGDFFEQLCSRQGDAAAFIEQDRTLTYAEMWRDAGFLGGHLQQECAIEAGARIAVMLPNRPEFAVSTCAIQRIGAVQVNVNPNYVARELAHQLADSSAEAIILAADALPVLEAARPSGLRSIIVVDHGGPAGPFASFGAPVMSYEVALRSATARPSVRSPDDLAFLQYTGGTTGRSKGAMLSHGNLLANIRQINRWMGDAFGPKGPTALTAIPLYHIFAMTVNMFAVLALGGRNVLVRDPRDIALLAAEWRRHDISFFTGVNTLFKALVASEVFAAMQFSPRLIAMGGGASIQRGVSDAWQRLTGRPIIEGYGLSEASPVLTVVPISEVRFQGHVGRPVVDTEVVIRDEAGRDLPDGEIGELCARGPQIMKGYWQQPDETARVMTPDGFLRTGDLAWRDADSTFRIADRAKDMILVSGFNVYPNEIEAIVSAMPGIAECACVGAPDARTGEAVILFVAAADRAVTPDEITDHCRRNLSAYKVPRHVFLIETIPKSSVGKILRRELRDEAVARLGEAPKSQNNITYNQ